ncbi:4Fe-4S dicluster domain-containing protein [Desulfovibrio sp. OttesenSCG-928-C14]|nr:4Fe-4S dicluster domain-containing protein [Desulfovibrio sp. OttesenSCG-928-C14]
MRKLSFKLTASSEIPPFLDGPDPDEVNIPLLGHKVIVKKNDEVCVGTTIGIHPNPKRGDAHSSIEGVVTKISHNAITVQKQAITNPVAECPAPRDISTLEGEELAFALKSLGLGMREFNKPGDHIVINGFNPEPGILWADGVFANYMTELKAAVGIVKRLMKPRQISVVLPQGAKWKLGEDVRHFYAKPYYPNSNNALVIKTATKKENPKGVTAVTLHTLWRYGVVAVSGMPALRTVVTVQDNNYAVLAGTSVRDLLAHAGRYPQEGDYVILGGYMRGRAISDLDQSLASYSYGLFHVGKDEFTHVHENPCINCGACVQYCPAHLMPNIISRNAEFQNYEECRRLSVNACMECGLCSYYCIARRPMMQYMREAKRLIAIEDSKLKMESEGQL